MEFRDVAVENLSTAALRILITLVATEAAADRKKIGNTCPPGCCDLPQGCMDNRDRRARTPTDFGAIAFNIAVSGPRTEDPMNDSRLHDRRSRDQRN